MYIFVICTILSTIGFSQKTQKEKSPKKAALYSAILPGAGQVYTKKYWKVPIVYGGLVTSFYFINENNSSYRGLLICSSGVGMSIAANKIKGIRAANVVDELTAIQSVEHNNVNVLCLGSNNVSNENALSIVLKFLNTYMLEEEKYSRRVGKLEN